MLALLAVKLLLPVRQHLTRTYTLTPTAHSLMTHSRRDGLEGALWARGWPGPVGQQEPASPPVLPVLGHLRLSGVRALLRNAQRQRRRPHVPPPMTRPCSGSQEWQTKSLYDTCSHGPRGPCAQWTHVRPHSPLDAEGQHNAIMALQRLLALVGGTRVPHLQKPGSGQIPAGPARWQGHYCTNDVSTGEQRKPCPRAGAGRGWCAVPSPAAPGCLAPGQAATHLDGLVRGPTEEQVPHGVDAETPDGALVAHKCSLALEDLLWVVGCRETGGMRCLGAWGPRGGQQGAHTHSRGCPCSAAR